MSDTVESVESLLTRDVEQVGKFIVENSHLVHELPYKDAATIAMRKAIRETYGLITLARKKAERNNQQLRSMIEVLPGRSEPCRKCVSGYKNVNSP